jgi:hypothetical protein
MGRNATDESPFGVDHESCTPERRCADEGREDHSDHERGHAGRPALAKEQNRAGKMARRRTRGIRCPNCLSTERPHKTRSGLPWYLAPLRLCFQPLRCDACLTSFYRVRLLGWMFRRRV